MHTKRARTYRMRQKLFAFGDDFTIQDESGETAFIVDGSALSLGKKLSLQDPAGNELATIRQKLLAWGPTYQIHRRGELWATVRKALFPFFTCRFEVDLPGDDDLEAEGDLTDHEYVFLRDGRQVAAVSKAWFSLADDYGVTVDEGEDDVLILASTVVIDMACQDDDD